MEINDPLAVAYLKGKYPSLMSSEEEIFAPALLFKKFQKGAGNSYSLFKLPKTMIILSFDGQTKPTFERVWLEDHPEDRDNNRIIIFNLFSEPHNYITSTGNQRFLDLGLKTMDMTLDILEHVTAHWLILDGLVELNNRVVDGSRKLAGVGLEQKITGKDMLVWDYRNRFYYRVMSLLYAHSKIAPVATTWESELDKEAIFGSVTDSVWGSSIRSQFRHTVKLTHSIKPGESRFFATYESLKDRRLGREGDTVDVTGDRPVFDPAKLLMYEKGVGTLNVVTPKVQELPKEEISQHEEISTTIKETIGLDDL